MELTRPQIWIAAFLTLGVYSYLVKENPWYRLAEHTFVAFSVAHSVTMSYHETFKVYKQAYIVENGWWWFWLFFAVGLLYYTRYGPAKYQWLSRYPISISIGWGLGSSLARAARPYLVQIVDTMRPWDSIENFLFFIMFVAVLMYFFFTIGSKTKVVPLGGRIGRWIMMVGFGASFGNTIGGRISLFLARLQFLLVDWMKLKI